MIVKKYLLILVVLFTIPVFAQLRITGGVDAFTKLLPLNGFNVSDYSIGAVVGAIANGGGSFYYGFSTGYYTDRNSFKAVPTVVKFRVGKTILTEINLGVWWVTGSGEIVKDVLDEGLVSIPNFKPMFNADLLFGVKPLKNLPARLLVGGRLLDSELYLSLGLSY